MCWLKQIKWRNKRAHSIDSRFNLIFPIIYQIPREEFHMLTYKMLQSEASRRTKAYAREIPIVWEKIMTHKVRSSFLQFKF